MIDIASGLPETVSFVRPDGTLLYDMVVGDDGVLRCRTLGFWSIEEADTYLADLALSVRRARQSTGSARILIDLRACSVHSAEVNARLFSADETMLNVRDWRAFVVESRLKAMQMRRGILFAGTQVFSSPDDAERWLDARR